MEKKPQNQEAFPRITPNGELPQKGMTLRDYFAAKAMESLTLGEMRHSRMSLIDRIKCYFNFKGWRRDFDINDIGISDSAYKIADQMLKERSKS